MVLVYYFNVDILFNCDFLRGKGGLPYENVCLKKEGIDPMKKVTREKCPKHVVIEKKCPSNFDNKIVNCSHQTTIFH